MVNVKDLLKTYFGYDEFRSPQQEIIESVLAGERTLALLPTGQGKSVCFQIPGLAHGGLTMVISPLIALMKDQVDGLHKRGILAHYINSTLSKAEIRAKYDDIRAGRCQFLYVAPERLLVPAFLQLMRDHPPKFIAVDEAHCFSTWGHDFRPHYRDITRFIEQLPTAPRLALFTATASPGVVEDLQQSFKIKPDRTFRGSFFRRNLFITTRRFELRSQRFLYLVYLLQHVHRNQSGLIYVTTRKDAEMLCQALSRLDFDHRLTLDFYHAGRTNEEKVKIQEKFINDQLKVIIATNAFGMGIDKANIRFVIHWQMPGSLENYVQEIGRAGRDGEFSWCELLFHPSDIEVHQQLQSGKKGRRGRKSLAIMLEYLESKQCHHQKILTYFQDPARFQTGCARCQYCSPYEQIFLKKMQLELKDQSALPTFIAQQQYLLADNRTQNFSKLIGVGLGMV
jgi:ATP-dependent DNA helicase RecQ